MFEKSTKISVIPILIAAVICFAAAFAAGAAVYAEDSITEADPDPFLITSVIAPDRDSLTQKITAYSGNEPELPEILTVDVETGESLDIPVSWTSSKSFSNKTAGTYTYRASIGEEYELSEGTVLPAITVKVVKCTTDVKEITMRPVWTSRKTAYDSVKVYNGYGRTMKLQMYSGGKWVTKKSYKLDNAGYQKIKVVYPDSWWKKVTTKWRLTIDSNAGATSFNSGTMTFKTKRYYQNPSKYVQISNDIKTHESGGYTLKPGYFGLKVKKVNSYFGIGDRNFPKYTSTTKSKVKKFQKKKGLKQTGYVNKKTWLAMGFSEKSWYDAYISVTDVNQSSSRSQHIEAMIDRAKEYLGTSYVYGASGYVGQGIDCSGLVIQCLYAAGVDPYPICSATHAYPENQYNSRKLYNYSGFKKVSYSNKKRGDLVFYNNSAGKVYHVAIYLGDGKVIEAYPDEVMIAKVEAGIHPRVAGVRRAFN